MDKELVLFLVLLVLITASAVYGGKLTIKASLVASIAAGVIFFGFGIKGVIVLGAFFISGVAATSWGKRRKSFLHRGEHHEKRDALQVFANGGVGLILGILTLSFPEHEMLFMLGLSCSFSAATADTVSSELGMVYGKRMYNILTLQPDQRGENGVISLEGTLCGILGSLIIGLLHALLTEWNTGIILIIVIAGTIGNITDSVLGATLERKQIIGNNAVNFLNTLMGAVSGMVAAYMIY